MSEGIIPQTVQCISIDLPDIRDIGVIIMRKDGADVSQLPMFGSAGNETQSLACKRAGGYVIWMLKNRFKQASGWTHSMKYWLSLKRLSWAKSGLRAVSGQVH